MQARLLASPSIPMHAHLHADAAAQWQRLAWRLAPWLAYAASSVSPADGKRKTWGRKKRQRWIGLVPAPSCSCGSRGNHIQRPNTVMPPLCSRLQARNPRKQRSPPTRVGKPNPLIISLNFSGSHVGGARTDARTHPQLIATFTMVLQLSLIRSSSHDASGPQS